MLVLPIKDQWKRQWIGEGKPQSVIWERVDEKQAMHIRRLYLTNHLKIDLVESGLAKDEPAGQVHTAPANDNY